MMLEPPTAGNVKGILALLNMKIVFLVMDNEKQQHQLLLFESHALEARLHMNLYMDW